MMGNMLTVWRFAAFFCVIVLPFVLVDLITAQESLVPGREIDEAAQDACTYAISPTGRSVSSAEEAGAVLVMAPDNCDWTAKSSVRWITLGPRTSGTGSGAITYSVGVNRDAAARVGTVTLAGQVFRVHQGAGATPVEYTLTVSKTGNGRGKVLSNPAGNGFKKGTWVALHAVPDDNSVFAGWKGTCSGRSAGCNVQVLSDRTVAANFMLKTYTIRVSPPLNGVIHPSGTIKAAYGDKRRFQVIPLPGYRIFDVLVDKVSVGAANMYTFEDVRADHILEAVFMKQ